MAAKSLHSNLLLVHICLFSSAFIVVKTWDQVDFELFDIVEEFKDNFYSILGVEPTATFAEIRKAYRRLSLHLHPDRNKAPDAELQFRRIVSVSEVLRDEDKRKRYDAILRDGLPDWRQPVFYYRRVRKMGFIEFLILVFLILMIGHFIVIWSIYLEKKFEMEELLSSKMKREEKKRRKAKAEFTEDKITELADYLVHETGFSRPTFFDLLPFKIYRFNVTFWTSLPAKYRAYQAHLEDVKRRKEEEEKLEMEEEEEEVEQPRPRRRQRVVVPEALPEDEDTAWVGAPVTNMIEPKEIATEDSDDTKIKSEDWTDEDSSHLSRAMMKFPGGTSKRWVKIAQELGRTVEMVTKQMKRIKQSQGVAVTSNQAGPGALGKLVTSRRAATVSEDIATQADPGETVTQNGSTDDEATKISREHESSQTILKKMEKYVTVVWSQNQQKLLEMALQQYPKTTPDRWTWIARNVPGMTKEDCIARYKTLVELMRQKKAQDAT